MSNYKITKFNKLESTNTYSLANISELCDKDVIIAEVQTSGRGRFNRAWVSGGAGNLYMTIVLKPVKIDSFPFQNMTQYLALCLCKVLEEYGLHPSLKWPNDVLVDGAKIAGILSEAHSENSKITAIVVGIGVNLNLKPETILQINQRATSLNLLLKKGTDKEKFAKKLLDRFFSGYNDFIEEGFSLIREDYVERCSFLGGKIKVSSLDKNAFYTAKTIGIDGTLNIIDENDNEINVITGDLIC